MSSRTFSDGSLFSVTATDVEYRVVSDPFAASPGVGSWRLADPATFSISFAELAGEAGATDEERFGLQWRAVNQQGGREAIRSAVFRVDTTAARVSNRSIWSTRSCPDRLTRSLVPGRVARSGSGGKPAAPAATGRRHAGTLS